MINVSAIRTGWHNLVGVQRAAILLLIAAALVELGAFIGQDFTGYDSPYHIFWIREWHDLWNAGILYPRWLPDSYHGFGEPSFYFYAPLTFVITNVVYGIFSNAIPQTVAKITILITLASSGLTMWLYLRSKNSGAVSSVLGALLYTFAPYRFFDYSVRSALSEHVAFIFIPLVFWGMDLLTSDTTKRRTNGFFLLALTFALIVITNVPLAVVSGLGLGIYALFTRPVFRNLLLLAGASISACILAAFYLLPAYMLSDAVQLHHLWTAPSVLISSPIFSIFIKENVAASLYNWLGFIAAWILISTIWKNKENDSMSNAMLWMLMLFIVLVLPYASRYLFNFVPPFTAMQRPERMTVLVLLIAALSWKSELVNSFSKTTSVFSSNAISIIVVIWSIGVMVLIAGQLAGLHAHVREYQPIGDAPEYAPRWLELSSDWGAKLSTPFANDSQTVAWQDVNPIQVTHATRTAYSDTLEYRSSVSNRAIFRRSYWPAWQAYLDSKQTSVFPDSLGRLGVEAPEGIHIISLSLQTPRAVIVGSWISMIGLIATIISFFAAQWYERRVRVSQ